MRRATAFVILLSLAHASAPAGLRAGSDRDLRVRLLETAEVASETVSLAHLLPTTALPAVRSRASEVNLGNAPLPGSMRVLERWEIEHYLRRMPELLSALQIPERVTVRRVHRILSIEEIRQAIGSALKQQGFGDAELPRSEDLNLAVPVFVIQEDPGLVVKRIEFDPVREVTQFCLWPSKERKALPFYVTVRHSAELPVWATRRGLLPGEPAREADIGRERRNDLQGLARPLPTATEVAGRPAQRSIAAGEIVNAETLHPRVQVQPGKPATMLVQGAGFRILTKVMPLQAGVQGQQIRVRSLDTQRILRAEVLAPDYLQETISEETKQ